MNHLGRGVGGISVYLWGPRFAFECELLSNHELQVQGDSFSILIQESPPCPQVKACSGFHRVTPSIESVNACPWWLESDSSQIFSLTSQSVPTSRISSGSPSSHCKAPWLFIRSHCHSAHRAEAPAIVKESWDLLLHSCCKLFRTRAAGPSVQMGG